MADVAKKLHELYVLVGENDEGQEGVASYVDPRDGVMKPALGGRQRVPELLVIGAALARESGRELILTKWTSRGNLEVIRPETKGEA